MYRHNQVCLLLQRTLIKPGMPAQHIASITSESCAFPRAAGETSPFGQQHRTDTPDSFRTLLSTEMKKRLPVPPENNRQQYRTVHYNTITVALWESTDSSIRIVPITTVNKINHKGREPCYSNAAPTSGRGGMVGYNRSRTATAHTRHTKKACDCWRECRKAL